MISSFGAGLGPIGKALGWMLIHSLWQISLVALILSLALRMIPRKQANSRYVLLLFGLVGVVGWSALTFQSNWAYYAQSQGIDLLTEVTLRVSPIEEEVIAAQVSSWQQNLQAGISWMDSQLNLVTFIWMIGVVLSCLYLITGLSYLHYLQTHKVKAPEAEWADRFTRLCRQMGIRRKVRFLLSEVVHDPITFRLLRPVILLPTSLMMGLAPKQIELLLLHELAHIRRYDFTVNILQTLVEIVFFYHPALWWISRNIRTTREHCCDDAVLAVQNQPVLYAEALTRIPTSNLSLKQRLAMSANNNKGTLSKRIFRLFGRYESQPPIYRSILMAFLLLVISLGSQAFMIPEDSLLESEKVTMIQEAPLPQVQEKEVVSEPLAQMETAAVAEDLPLESLQSPLAEATPPIIEGKVLDENDQPLIGVSILVKNTTVGTVTDFDGQFRLKLPSDCATLVFSYIGKETKEIDQICEDQNLDLVMKSQAAETLPDAVVIGQKKKPEAAAETTKEDKVIISGTIKDENNQALVGTTVLIKDGKIGTITDLEGNYRLELPSECATLVFSYIGKQTQEATNICGSQNLDIILQVKKEGEEQEPAAEPTQRIELPEVEVTTSESKILQDLTLFPNPSSGNVTVSFKLAKPTKVIIGVYTVDGKPITLNVLGLGAGTHRHVWKDDETRKGAFLLQIQAEGEKVSKPFIIE